MEEAIKLWFKENFTEFDSEEGLNPDNPFELKRVNVLVGANNSGKSRFMRKLALKIKDNEIRYRPTKTFRLEIEEVSKQFDSAFYAAHNLLNLTIDNNLVSLDQLKNYINKISEGIDSALGGFKTAQFPNHWIFNGYDSRQAPKYLSELKKNLKNIDKYLIKTYPTYFNLNYIGALRSLKKLPDNSLNNPLIKRTTIDYSFKENQVITGEDFFDFLTNALLGMPDDRQKVNDYQQKLSHYFFNNQTVTIIPHLKDDSIHIKIGNDDQFPIADLGDGLQQVIILTYKAFLTTEPAIFLIEEPEMHLHAGYVKQLVKFLLNETDHYYIMTSHSNYLLDMVNEDNRIALYRVDKKYVDGNEPKPQTIIKRCDGDRTILQTLGVSPSSVFLANCTIWMEGITDRLYFVQYLKKYLEELKTVDEDKWYEYSRFIDGYHYAFVEYQGSNLQHWDFAIDTADSVDSSQDKGLPALLVSSHALVIADADLQGKRRFSDLKNQLNDNLIITEGKETENTLPRELLIKQFFQRCPAHGLSKSGNSKKLEFKDDYLDYFDDSYQTSDKGIGLYLDIFLENMRTDAIIDEVPQGGNSFTFSDKSGQGTVKNKTDFCHDIVDLMQTEEWHLTDSAKKLCKVIFEHIAKNNPN